jgi:hypothetical protein
MSKTLNKILKKLDIYESLRYIYYALLHILAVGKSKKRKLGYIDPKYSALLALKDCYSNKKRCFIVCTGPSLLINDLERLKDEYTFSMNSIFKIFDQTNWRPTYYCVTDRDVYNAFSNDIRVKEFQNKLYPDIFHDTDCILFPFDRGIFEVDGFLFSDNAYIIVNEAGTITVHLMQLAVYMGFKEIYLLGCDCNYSGPKQHFVDYGSKVTDNPEERMISAYKVAKEYADAHGIKIYNATRGGKLEVFERVDFDTLFETNTEDEDGTENS